MVPNYTLLPSFILFNNMEEVSMEETLCTVERGSSNCLAATWIDFIGEC